MLEACIGQAHLKMAAREKQKCVRLSGVQEDTWEKDGTQQEEDYTPFY
jgi:hypothetical protein